MCSVLMLLLAITAPLLGTGLAEASARPEISAVFGGVVDRQATMIIDLPGESSHPIPPEAFSASVRGKPQSGQVGPLMSDKLALSFVLDASLADSSGLPEGASGMGNFLLAQFPSVAAPWSWTALRRRCRLRCSRARRRRCAP